MTTSAVNPPDGNSCIGIVAPTILTWSSVAIVLALNAIAATPTFPPTILVLEMVCSPSTIVIPKKRLSDNLLFSILKHPLFSATAMPKSLSVTLLPAIIES
jgi:hypothetical protein